jgi:ATP-dependent RNA helicase DeaD
MLIFVRTKLETIELADRLEARGFSAVALNGDIPQQQRERTIAQLKSGQIDMLVATDVAARGLDVERISHVVNYDIPYDSETYIHRIGRTGRAGRSGEAILFVAPRERNMLRIIESATKQRLEEMTLPSVADVNEQRALKFKERVVAAVRDGLGRPFEELLQQIEREQSLPAIEIAAGLAGLLQGSTPFLLSQKPAAADSTKVEKGWAPPAKPDPSPDEGTRRPREEGAPMESFRIEVGHVHGVLPGNIVGAITNEAGIEGQFIGHVDIREDHSFVDLVQGMPDEILSRLKKVRVRGEALRISRVDSKPPRPERQGRGRPIGKGYGPSRFSKDRKSPRARK